MRNSIARLVHRDPAKPTLRERAASLKASAARVIRRPAKIEKVSANAPPSAPAFSPLPDPVGLAEACDWAAKHVGWINDTCGGEGWDDERFKAEIAKHSEIWDRAIVEPAASLSDLAAKARLFGKDWARHNPDDGSRDGLDMMMVSILRDVAALEAARPTLTDRIVAGWAEWSKTRADDESPTGLAAWERTAALRDDLIRRAVALPATAESIPAKAFALAWVEFVDVWFDGRPREDYTNDGKLALDIHDAVQAAAHRHALPPVETASMPDLATLSLGDLCALHDVADLLHELGHALKCQPRCWTKEKGDKPTGVFVERILGQCSRMMDDCEKEAERRKPTSSWETDQRLRILALAVIENGDPKQTAAFARDLQATVA